MDTTYKIYANILNEKRKRRRSYGKHSLVSGEEKEQWMQYTIIIKFSSIVTTIKLLVNSYK